MSTTLSLPREELLHALQTVCSVVEKKSTLPVVANILFELDGKNLVLTGTDCEIELKSFLTLTKEHEAFKTTLPGRKLLEICRSFPDHAEVKIKFDQNSKATVTSEQRRFVLSTLPAEDFPFVKLTGLLAELELPQNELRQLMEHTYFAMAQQDVRHYLNGMLLEVSKDSIRTVAADGHRLATSASAVSLNITKSQQVIIPRKGVIELLRVLKEDGATVKLSLFQNHIQMKGEKYLFITKLVEGRYPDYQKVLPLETDRIVFADRAHLLQGLQSAAILNQEKGAGVWIKVQPQLMRISSTNQEHDEAEIEMPIDYSHDELEIALNAVYLIDALQALKSVRVEMHLGGVDTSTLLKSIADQEQQETLYVIMPMRL